MNPDRKLELKAAALLARQRDLPLSYGAAGLTRVDAPRGFQVDQNRIELGSGEAVFESACRAIADWAMFPAPWTRIHPAGAPIEAGTVVAVVVRHAGIAWINPCRIVEVIDEREPVRRFGFAYGTLPAHAESGEERFLVVRHADGRVFYSLRAVSRPGHWWTRAGHSLVRRLQKRFARESMAAMKRAVSGGA